MIFLSLFSGLYIRYNLYGTDTVSITSYDMMPVQKMSTFFCEAVTIEAESSDIPLAVYRLNNKPRINYTHTVYYSENIFTLLVHTKKLFHFYLMAGSSITLSFCSKLSVTLTFIKGTENYENYFTTMNYNKYTEVFTTMFKCSSKVFDITESNRYYFLIGQNWRSTLVELNITLQKTTYQVHGYDSNLESILWKSFVPLKFQSTETIIYQPVLKSYQELTVTTHCEPMNSVYLGLFLCAFLVLGLILSYFVKCFCKDPIIDPLPSAGPPENASSHNLSNTEPTPIHQIHPTAPPLTEDESTVPCLSESQQVPSSPPPSYESLFANGANNDPPPYVSTIRELDRK